MKASCTAVFLVLWGFLTQTWAQGIDHPLIKRLSDGALLGLSKLTTELRGAKVIIVGEQHDEPAHHRAQLSILRSLSDSGVPLAIGMEMFGQDAQGALERWSRGEMAEEEMEQLFQENWSGTSWVLYRDILLFARDRRIPIVGLNLPREITQKVAREGYGALPEEVRQKLGDLRCDVDPVYRTFLLWAFEAHRNDEERGFDRFCLAQVLWDTAMARAILRFLRDNQGSTMVVLAGVGHAWNRGIPKRMAVQEDFLYRVIIPETVEKLRVEPLDPEDADYLWLRLEDSPSAEDPGQ